MAAPRDGNMSRILSNPVPPSRWDGAWGRTVADDDLKSAKAPVLVLCSDQHLGSRWSTSWSPTDTGTVRIATRESGRPGRRGDGVQRVALGVDPGEASLGLPAGAVPDAQRFTARGRLRRDPLPHGYFVQLPALPEEILGLIGELSAA